MGYWLPDPRFEMPELFEPGRQPTGPVKIDTDHKYAPNGFFYLGSGLNRDKLTNKEMALTAGSSLSNLSVEPKGGNLVVIADGVTDCGFVLPEEIVLDNDTPYEITVRINNLGTGNEGMIIGKQGVPNYWWITSGWTSWRVTDGVIFSFSYASGTAGMETHTITSDGGGLSSGTGKYYIDGLLKSTATGKSMATTLLHIIDAYAVLNYGYAGEIEYIRASYGKLYSANHVREIHQDPYQFFEPV